MGCVAADLDECFTASAFDPTDYADQLNKITCLSAFSPNGMASLLNEISMDRLAHAVASTPVTGMTAPGLNKVTAPAPQAAASEPKSFYEFEKNEPRRFAPRDVHSEYCFSELQATINDGEKAEESIEVEVELPLCDSSAELMRSVQEQRSRVYEMMLEWQKQEDSSYNSSVTGLGAAPRSFIGRPQHF
ncbi:unnamed protein product, partial [Mesorhabditis belari]|uniref:Uncharacterized protein n=1 Tax=Mesorhabditis belari TaxID=2138241 RepID=A0AAF3FCA4_9BILA